MDSCQRFKEMVSGYIEGGLDQQNRVLMEEHLRDCLKCKATIKQLKSLTRNLKELPRLKVSPNFETILRARISMESSLARRHGRLNPLGQFRLPVYAFSAIVITLLMFAVLSRINNSKTANTPIAKENNRVVNKQTLPFSPGVNDSIIYFIEKEPLHGIRSQGTKFDRQDNIEDKVGSDSTRFRSDQNLYFDNIYKIGSKVY